MIRPVMLVLGGNTNGGIHGQWPGLANEDLYDGADLAVTTDFRRVLSEVLIRRMGNNKLGIVFPGYSDYQPLGVVSGTDLPPDYSADGSTIFNDGFETGDNSRWSSVTGLEKKFTQKLPPRENGASHRFAIPGVEDW